MSDYDSIQELGGADLAKHYPDQGQIAESHYYNAVVRLEYNAPGTRGWLKRLLAGNQGFLAILSANAAGLRIVVSLYDFAIFIPWPAAIVLAERSWSATVVRIRTTAVPTLDLEFHVDDVAADDLLRDVIQPLPQRDPPRALGFRGAWTIAWVSLAFALAVCIFLLVNIARVLFK